MEPLPITPQKGVNENLEEELGTELAALSPKEKPSCSSDYSKDKAI